MSERNWTPEPWASWAGYGLDEVKWPITQAGLAPVGGYPDSLEIVAEAHTPQDQARIVSCVNALAAVGNPKGLPELLRVLRDPAGEPPIIGRGDGYVEMPLAKYLRIRDAFDALQIDPEKLP